VAFHREGDYLNLNLSLSGEVNYDIVKLSNPHRIVVDIKGIEINKNQFEIPKPQGKVKDVRISNYEQEGLDVVRTVFELNNFYGYDIKSDNPAEKINLSILDKEESEEKEFSNLIVIDAGHGGFDPGAIGPSGLEEKEVNLAIARKVNDGLKNSGYNVVMTRKKDKFISLTSRVKMAKEKDAGIFLSIHINASNKSYTQGTETFVAKDGSSKDMELAEIVQAGLIESLKLENRGVRKDNFYVIRNTPMPSILVELAFISNPHEESLLSNDLFREKAANSIIEGLIKYLKNKKLEDEGSNEY
jgi:N-acetylmuramoyl-L-alanine amidase